MALFAKVFKGMLGCALALSLFPLCAYADDVENDVDSDSILVEDTEDDIFLSEEDETEGETRVVSRSGIQDDATIIDEGDFGEGNTLHWSYWDDATLVISGSGQIPDFTDKGGQPWNAYMELVETVRIDEGITKIGAYSFYSFNLITEMNLPETLESVGDYAFAKMTRLENVELPDSVTELGEGAFFTCQAMKTCHLSENIKLLPEKLFYRCKKLQEVNIPSAAESIETNAFYRWSSDVNASLKSPSFPANLKHISASAFDGISLAGDLVIPKTLTTAAAASFWSVKIDGDVIFEEGCKSSAYGMWVYSTADKVRIPRSCAKVPSIDARYEYVVDESNPSMTAFEGCLYSRRGTNLTDGAKNSVLCKIPTKYSGELVIPEGTEETQGDGGAFISDGITRVQVPSTMRSLPNPGSTFVGTSVTAIDVSPDNLYFASIDGVLFTKDAETLLRFPLAHPQQQYRIPASVKKIGTGSGRGPFSECSNLKSVIFPSGVENVTGLLECKNLVSIYIPRTVSSIDSEYLGQKGRSGITIFYEGSKEEWDNVKVDRTSSGFVKDALFYYDVSEQGINDDGMLFYIDHDRTLHVVPDEKAKTISYVIKDISNGIPAWCTFRSDFDKVRFSNTITTIGANAFKDCENITDVVIPSSVTAVGAGAFAGCSALREVECLGNGFQVAAAGDANPSFDASTATLLYQANARGWTDSPVYDAVSLRWNGYRLRKGEQASLPAIGSVLITDGGAEIAETRMAEICEIKRLKVVILSTEGEDITDKVTISIEAPERERPVTAQARQMYDNDEFYQVSYASGASELLVGGATAPGIYSIKVSPIQGEATGDSLAVPFSVTREAEEIFWCTGNVGNQPTVTLTGNRAAEKTTMYRYDAWNQYGESVWDRCDIRFIDKLSDTDVTDQGAKTGLSLDRRSENIITISQLAVPRDYAIRFSLDDDGCQSTFTGNLYVRRDVKLLNDPWSITLSGGDDEVYPQEQDTWSSVPYHVRVLDCYEDPCWPELDWKISKSDGEDARAHFELDAQGYLKIKASAQGYADAGGAFFKISSTTAGHDYQGSSSVETLRESNVLDFRIEVKEFDSEPIMHTAVFKVGDEVVATIAFAEGDTSLDEPAVPQKDNYVGAWEEYDLASATGDIVIQGRYTPLDPDKISDIELKGDANYENGAVTISLAASAASKQIRIQSTQTRPLDVVLVCDQSGSMDETLGSGEKKVDALKRCANQFVNALYENSVKTKADHRIALVGFSYSEYSGDKKTWNASGYENTGLLVTQSGGFKKFGDEARRSYDEAFLSVAGSGGVNNRIVAGINSITAEGATAADLGLNLAKGVFAANPDTGTNGVARERVVVFITDGVPTDWSNERERMKTTGANAIQIARDIKQGQGAHIYSVGVDAQASPSAAFWSSSDGVGYSGNALSYDLNRFLHAVSSNYPGAAAMDALGSGTKDGGYYMAVNDTVNLNKIFSSILYSTVYTVESFDRATLVYTLPANFILTMKQEEEMRAALMEQGLAEDDIIVSETGGTTTIVFKNVKVKTEYENGVPRYVAQVKFQVSAKNGVSGLVSAGSASVDKNGDVTECVLSDVVVPQDRCVLVFKVNDAVYEVRDAAMGDVVELPDTDIARWMDLEKKVDPKVDSAYAIFETTTLDRKYTLRWVVGDNELVEAYAPGATVRIPKQVEQWVPEDHDLEGWAPSLPSTMPGRNIMCTAVLTPKHEHAYTASEYRTGDCTKGQVIHRVCVCGDETEVGVAPAAAHDFDVIMGCPNNSKALTVEELVCKTCGHTIEKHVTYEVSKSQWGSSKLTVIDMSKYNGELQQNGISDDQIEMRFYIDTSFYDKNARYVVTRIDEDGNHYDYETRLQNGYLIFDPDHFSIYVIGAVDEKTGEPSQIGMSYEEALSLLASPDPDEEPTGGPGETIGSTAPESSPHGPGSSNHGSGGGSHYTTGWALDSKRIDDLVNTTITSSEGVDLSLRSPKTGQICLRHFSIPYAKDGIRAA